MDLTCPSFKKCCHQRLSSSWCLYIKFLSSHVEYSAGKFFHLMRYPEIDRFRSCRVLFSVTAPGSNMVFPSSSSSGNIVWTGIFCNFWISGHTLLCPLNEGTLLEWFTRQGTLHAKVLQIANSVGLIVGKTPQLSALELEAIWDG